MSFGSSAPSKELRIAVTNCCNRIEGKVLEKAGTKTSACQKLTKKSGSRKIGSLKNG
jgi:hypothetical protein